MAAINAALECTKTEAKYDTSDYYIPLYMSVVLMVAAIAWHYLNLFSNYSY